jgi:hypothetical protein
MIIMVFAKLYQKILNYIKYDISQFIELSKHKQKFILFLYKILDIDFESGCYNKTHCSAF